MIAKYGSMPGGKIKRKYFYMKHTNDQFKRHVTTETSFKYI